MAPLSTKAFVKRNRIKLIGLTLLLIAYYCCLPQPLFTTPTATVIESSDGTLLGAKIASDGQWRFPKMDTVPEKFKQCIVQFEDAYFYQHPGINPVSMGKALVSNIKAGKTVRGGSTLTQQVIRLSRKGTSRTYLEKLWESTLATRLEFRYSKDEILNFYASYAPFGGNVVGLDMASWRYFGVLPQQLSWAESATLAVLPNAPSIIYPGKNQETLHQKRDQLLLKLKNEGIIDDTTYQLALAEDLPQQAFPIPRTASHLTEYIAKKHKGERLQTTIDQKLQHQVNTLVAQHHRKLKQNHVYNASVLVLDVATRNVLAYVGNAPTDNAHEKDVDMMHAPRSTGSVLKPLLYAAMLDNGELLPQMLIPDVPTEIAGYQPENFDESYSGAVPADEALARSLNIPAVRLLQRHGLEKFRDELDAFHLKNINKPANHYGLTLILGGAESNLWDLCKTYASLAATLNHFNETSSEYYTDEFQEPNVYASQKKDFGSKSTQKTVFNAGSIYSVFEAMKQVNRPDSEVSWEYFDSSREIAWKTGTSFGNKDAWAIGVNKKYVVGVWVGNADGEGRPQITGTSSAAPLLFDVFNVLPKSSWFEMPYDEMMEVRVCAQSGYLASDICPAKTQWVPKAGAHANLCHYHHTIHVDTQHQFRVNSSCETVDQIAHVSWFTLPPLMEFFYKKTHANYKTLPPFRTDCTTSEEKMMEFIYPKDYSTITLAKDFDGKINELVVKVAHRKPATTLLWYLDDSFLKQTTQFHEVSINPPTGQHLITVTDIDGNTIASHIIINK
ncbi:penicillin-binding protein 1C [Pustulibacterium marinum]|nr:penicillin-binding protein 1C [Pustulibacterium marinum]